MDAETMNGRRVSLRRRLAERLRRCANSLAARPPAPQRAALAALLLLVRADALYMVAERMSSSKDSSVLRELAEERLEALALAERLLSRRPWASLQALGSEALRQAAREGAAA